MLVRLQKHKAYTYKADSGKEIQHYKHLVVIPEDVVETLGWKEGIELTPIVQESTLVLKWQMKGKGREKA